jgi:cytochrome bd-type quinol oxidase subunit 1
MAISGDSFCLSAWNGFLLNIKHLLKFTFANFLAKVFTLLGKIGIVVGNLVSLFFITKFTKEAEDLNSYIGPMALVGIVSYFTASIFLGLFDTAIMALMTSLAVDMDVHDGTPAFGPPTFHDGINKVEKN